MYDTDESYRPPSEYERMILNAMQDRPMYQGYKPSRYLPGRPARTPAKALPPLIVDDPRMAQVEKRRARNRVARRQRRMNRLAAKR